MEATMMPATQWRVAVIRQSTLEEYAAALQARLNEFSREGFTLYRMEPMRVDVHIGSLSKDSGTCIEWFTTIVIGVRGTP